MNQSLSISWSESKVKPLPKKLSPEKLTNSDLILRTQEGFKPDPGAFAELLRRYQPQVDRLLYHLAPEGSDRSDLAQEVWLRVYRYLKTLQDPEKFSSWLNRITTNIFYDYLRKSKNRGHLVSLDAPLPFSDQDLTLDLPSPDPGPDESLSTQEFYEQLQIAIADLPETFRTTIVLREMEGMTYEEIASLTGVSLGTVKSRIARARAKLQDVLKNYL